MKNIFIAVLLFLCPYMVLAQNISVTRVPSTRINNDIENYKVAYLAQKLELTSKEAKIFWPIYNNWSKEQAALRKERIENLISFRKFKEIEDLSDSEVQSLIINELNFKQKELNLEKKYYYQLKSHLPIKVIGRFYRAQETFKKELLIRFQSKPAAPSSRLTPAKRGAQ